MNVLEKKIIYLSHFISEKTPSYGGEVGTIKFEQIRSIAKGDNSNNLQLTFPNHIGTHIDFPLHFSIDGMSLNDYSPNFWFFTNIGFLTCEISNIENHLCSLSSDIEILIIKTGFQNFRDTDIYWKEQPVIPHDLAQKLKIKFTRLRIFGFDMISLTSKLDRNEGKKAHFTFLINNEILILEDMKLDLLTTTPKQIIVSPLLINNADGVPCTVYAITE